MPTRTLEEYESDILNNRGFGVEAKPIEKKDSDVGLSTAAFGESFLGKMTMATYDHFYNESSGIDKDYDVYDDIIRDGLIGWSSYLDDAKSRDQYYFKKSIVEQSLENERILSEGGAQGAAYQLMWGLADPVNFVPIVGASSKVLGAGASLTSKVATTAAIGGAAQAGQEAILSVADPTFKQSDALFSIGAATVLSGVLGPMAMSALEPKVRDDFSKGFAAMGAQKPIDMSGSVYGAGTAGAAQVSDGITKESLEPLSSFGIGRATAFIGPSTRLQNSPSEIVRKFNSQINETSLMTKGNVQGIASDVSIESERRLYMAMESQARAATYDSYLEYRKSLSGKTGNWLSNDIKDITGVSNKSGILTRQQFYNRVGQAMRRGDKAEFVDFVDANQYIENAAKANRQFSDQILNEMIDAKLFDGVPDIRATAESWFRRMYDRQRIISDPDALQYGISKFYKQERDAAIASITVLKSEISNLKNAMRLAKKAKNEEDISLIGKQISDKREARKAAIFMSKVIDEELDSVAYQTVDRIKGSPLGIIDYDIATNVSRDTSKQKVPGMRGTKERKLNIPDTYEWDYNGKSYKFEDFLVSDPTAMTSGVVRSVVPDLLMYRKFGTLDMQSILDAVSEDYRKLTKAAKTAKERAILEKKKNADLEDLRDSMLIIRGAYANRDDYFKAVPTALRMAKQVNYLSLMGEMTISSAADIGSIVMEYGMKKTFGNVFKSFVPNLRSAIMDLSLDEQKKLVTGIESVMNDRFAAIYDADIFAPAMNKVEGGLNYASAAMQKISLMNTWLDALRPLAGMLEQDRIIMAAKKVASGKNLTKIEQADVGAQFLNNDDLIIIAEQFSKYGKEEGSLFVPNMRLWDIDNPAVAAVQRKMRAGIAKKVDTLIIKPGSEIPKAIKKGGVASAILQFKSFMFSATNKLLTRSAQRASLADKRLVMGLATMVALGAVSYATKSVIAGRPVSDNPSDWVMEGIDRSGILGFFGEINNITEKLTGGKVGIRPIIGAKPATRYINRNHLETALGPTAGLFQDFGELVQSASSHGNLTQGDLNKIRRHIPFQNALGFRYLFDSITEGTGDLFNVPDKR